MRKLRSLHTDSIRTLITDTVATSEGQRFLHRLHCVLLVSIGRSCYEVAAWFGEDPRTIERWVHAHEKDGAGGLHDHHGGGRPARLSVNQARHVAQELGASPLECGYDAGKWNGRLLELHLEGRYGVRLGVRQCQRILRAVHSISSDAHDATMRRVF